TETGFDAGRVAPRVQADHQSAVIVDAASPAIANMQWIKPDSLRADTVKKYVGATEQRTCPPAWRPRNRKDALCFSPYLYRARNLVERFFNKIKHCRRVATRYDKLAANYLPFIQLASMRLWLRVNEYTAYSAKPVIARFEMRHKRRFSTPRFGTELSSCGLPLNGGVADLHRRQMMPRYFLMPRYFFNLSF